MEMGKLKSEYGETRGAELRRWCTWLCQPHTFVTLCLARRFTSVRNGAMGKAFLVLLRLQAVADLLSVVALWGLLAPPAPAGLAHGAGGLILAYSLTTASVVGSAIGLAVPSVQALKSGELESGGLVVVFGAMALLSVGVALVGAYLIILAPFQLAGLQLDGVPLM